MDETRFIELSGRRWTVRPAAEPLLADGWPPDHPERLTLVKRGHRRNVLRLEVGGMGFFLKEYEPRGIVGRIAAALGMSPARREWQALTAARAAGLDCPEPVALAHSPREAILTREIPAAQRLDEYIFERYFEPLPGDPPYPGARPPELVSVYRRRITPPSGTISPRALAAALADLVAGLIRAGLAPNDFHPGNILISGGPGAPSGHPGTATVRAVAGGTPAVLRAGGAAPAWRLSLVDLAAAELGAGPEEVGLACLTQLEHFFEPIAGLAERMRCLAILVEQLRSGGKPAWTLEDARHLSRATARYRQAFYRHRDHRLRRASKYFRRIAAGPRPGDSPAQRRPSSAEQGGEVAGAGPHAGRWRGWATGDWADAIEAWLATAADRLSSTAGVPRSSIGNMADLFGPDAQVLKAGGTSTVIRTRLGGASPAASAAGSNEAQWLIIKRHNRARRRGAVHGLLGGSRSVAAFRSGHALLARGIATARPAAAADLVRHGKVRDSLLITEAVDDAMPLPEWLRSGPAPALRRRVTRRLARLVRRLHDSDLADRDLKAPNILIAAAHGPDPRPVLVDLDGLRGTWRVSARRRARDLMRLSVSLDEWGVARLTDRLRFLRAYLGRAGCPGPITILGRRRGQKRPARRLRRWWRRIARLSVRKMEALSRKTEHMGL